MYGNGAAIGMALIHQILRITQLAHHRDPLTCFAAAVGTPVLGAAGSRVAATVVTPFPATTIWESGWYLFHNQVLSQRKGWQGKNAQQK